MLPVLSLRRANGPAPIETLDYEEQKRRLQDPDPATRAALACHPDARPEVPHPRHAGR